MLNHLNGAAAANGTVSKPVKVGRLVPDSMLPAVKKAIDGSDLTKIALIEHLKKLYVFARDSHGQKLIVVQVSGHDERCYY